MIPHWEAPPNRRAPHLAGALLLLAFVVGAISCKEDHTPDWEDTLGPEAPAEPALTAEPAPSGAAPDQVDGLPEAQSSAANPEEPPEQDRGEAEPAEQSAVKEKKTLRFLSYNLENYLTMTRYQDGKRIETKKPDREKAAIVKLVVSSEPDVVGVCEIGTTEDLADLQKRLAEAGLELPHLEHTGGADDTRHLGLLSRFPITARDSKDSLTYDLMGRKEPIRRGILDATVAADGREVRFLGVHLKSKREIPEGDQELIRRNEAYLLRKHADSILAQDPDVLLCAYGDLNDTRRTTTVRSVKGPYGTPRFLEDLMIRDSRGMLWTHYWDYQHIYSRFDFVLVSPALKRFADLGSSYILDDPDWKTASDHRAILAVFEWD